MSRRNPPTVPYRYTMLPRVWPGRPHTKPRKSPFHVVTVSQADKLLQKELQMVGAQEVTIAVDTSPFHFKPGGEGLRADAKMTTAAVIVTFTDGKGNRLTFPCNTFGDWVDNLYAIASSLEKLRAVDRYGVTQGDAQYVGFKALPPAGGSTAMTPENAAAVLAEFSGLDAVAILQFPSVTDVARDIARKRTHPDTAAGESDGEDFARVEKAYEVLEEHHAAERT